MRYLVISDIHGNYPALQSVLMDAAGAYDAVWCLGDLVGYGPNPNQCVERVASLPSQCIAGNHDWGVIGCADLLIFNVHARQALYWTQMELQEEYQDYLRDLPTSLRIGDTLLVHGSVRDPIWEYVLDVGTAQASFESEAFNLCLVGHTHIPLLFEWLEARKEVRILLPDWDAPIHLEGRRLIINPGSVGQPRDGDPRASYGILDTEAQTFQYRRVAYPVEITQEQMRARGLPQRLIDRLELGR